MINQLEVGQTQLLQCFDRELIPQLLGRFLGGQYEVVLK